MLLETDSSELESELQFEPPESLRSKTVVALQAHQTTETARKQLQCHWYYFNFFLGVWIKTHVADEKYLNNKNLIMKYVKYKKKENNCLKRKSYVQDKCQGY